MRRTLLWTSCLLAAACESPSGPQVAARLAVLGGDEQTATVGHELPEALVLRVDDDRGRPVRDQVVNFVVTGGGGSVFAGTALTDRDGVARERWTLGTTAGEQTLEARAVDPATGAPLVFATFRAEARPDVPAEISPLGGASRAGALGQPLPDSVAVRVADRYGNPVPGAAMVWTVRGGGGTVSPGTGATDASGTARASWTLGLQADSAQVLEAAAGITLRVELTATAGLGPGTILSARGGDAQSGEAGETLAEPLRVRVTLADGRAVRGVRVDWAASAGILSPSTDSTDHDGESASAWTLPTAAGWATATASVVGLPPISFAARVSPAAPATVQKAVADGWAAFVEDTIPDSLAVRVADRFGNPVEGVAVEWEVESGGGSVSPRRSVTGPSGFARALWVLGPVPGEQGVRGTAAGLPPVRFVARASRRPALIAFAGPDAIGRYAIHVMRENGAGRQILVGREMLGADARDVLNPDFSPSGDSLVFILTRFLTDASTDPAELWVMAADSTGLRRLVSSGTPFLGTRLGDPWEPRWSPTGDRIAFATHRGIFTVRPDGTELRQVTAQTTYGPAAWSPDGTHLVFPSNSRLYVIRADGTGLRAVTSGYRDLFPDWSPDGTRLLFSSDFRVQGVRALFTVGVDGTGLTQLTTPVRGSDNSPRWSPDGTRIVFYSDRTVGPHEIYMMDADGSGLTRVTNTPDNEILPVFRP